MSNFNKMEKCRAEKCEEWLNYEPTLTQAVYPGTDELYLTLDSGSTFTRFRTYDNEVFEFGDLHQLNADAAEVTNIEHIKSSSKSLYSRLEFYVQDVTLPEKKPAKLFETAHFVKGDILVNMQGKILERSSCVSKTKNISTFYNIISALTLEILEDVHKGNVPKKCYHAHLTLTMPPKDFKSKKTLNEFKEKLQGHYLVTMPRINFKTNIYIESDIYFENEPTAIVFALANEEDDDTETSILDKTAILVDGGGGTIDKAVVIKGQLSNEHAETGEYGGKILLNTIARIYQSETGRSKPLLEDVEASLDKGVLTCGNTKTDIFEFIKAAKETTAQEIFSDLTNLCDSMHRPIDTIEEVILHGRLFKETATEDGRVTSIASILSKKLKEIAPDIKVSLLVDNHYVCSGAVVSLWVADC